MRNFTRTLVAASLLTATNANSLGIGGIKLHSALNQNLNAEIALVTSGETPEDISVKLAPPAKFNQAGIPWSYFLSKIKFTTVVKPNGSVVIKLFSSEALKEPFLDFLLEVSWPKGSLYREFTVLVDPPATYKQAVVPVITRDAEPAPRYPTADLPPALEVTPKATQADKFAETETEPVTEYGPVRRNDTLWRIARRVKTDEVTVAQMVMAIYEANPKAFSKPNVKALMAGKILNIPEPDVVLKLTHSEALSQYRQHKRNWRREIIQREQRAREILQAKRAAQRSLRSAQELAKQKDQNQEAISETKPEAIVAPAPKAVEQVLPEPNKQLTLEPPAEEVVSGKTVVVASGGKQTGVEPDNQAAASSSAALKNQFEKDNKTLEERFKNIEQQLVMMQKMLELKDEQLATLQNQQMLAKREISPNDLETLSSDAVPGTKSEAPTAPPVESKQASAPDQATEMVLPESADVSKVPTASPPRLKPKPLKTKESAPAPINEVDPYADYYLILGGMAVTMLSGLGLVWWRKRKSETRSDTDMFAASSQITLPEEDEELSVALVDDSSAYNVGMVGESAFLSEFTPSEFDAFETHQTEIDPISEADVYLAYGRYQQAEDLMRQAIQDYPERDDCKLKLLEIFHANENKPAFDVFAQELVSQGKHNDKSFWDKVVEMAEELSPGSGGIVSQAGTIPIAAGSAVKTAKASTPPVTDAIALNNPLEFDLTTFSVDDDSSIADLSAFDTAVDFEPSTQAAKSAPVISDRDTDTAFEAFQFDKNIHSGNRDLNNNQTVADKTNQAIDDLDFNLDLFSAEQTGSVNEAGTMDLDDDFNSMDFDLSSFTNDKATPIDDIIEIIDEDDDNGLDFDLSSFTAEKKPLVDEDVEVVDQDDVNSLEFDLNSFDRLGESITEEGIEPVSRAHIEDSDLPVFVDDFEKFDFSDVSDIDNQGLDLTLDEEKLLKNYNFSVPSFDSGDDSIVSGQEMTEDQYEDLDFDFGFSKPDRFSATDSKQKGFNVDDLTDGEGALETKINLANAYIDMGDVDTARGIADELLNGTAEQKKAALEILNKIN